MDCAKHITTCNKCNILQELFGDSLYSALMHVHTSIYIITIFKSFWH